MNPKQKRAKDRSLKVVERVVLVAVKFSIDIRRAAFLWALNHVALPGDCVKLLVVIPGHSSSNFSFLLTFITLGVISHLFPMVNVTFCNPILHCLLKYLLRYIWWTLLS
jgi:hypothetical protein